MIDLIMLIVNEITLTPAARARGHLTAWLLTSKQAGVCVLKLRINVKSLWKQFD